jgi:hypothetical protein
MTSPLSHRPLVLGFHPTSRGFGWAVFESPFKLVSHGTCEPRGGKNSGCLRKLTWLLKVCAPEVLVIEAFDKQSSQRSERIRKLCLAAVAAAAEHNAEVDCLKRSDVQRTFEFVGAKTRDEIAEAVAAHVPTLRTHLPSRRKPFGDGEDKRLSVFAAAALVLTHYHNGAAALLDDLRNAA